MAPRNAARLDEIRSLIESGHGVTEIARILGISKQRASQLVHSAGYEFVTRLRRKPKKIYASS